MDRIYVFFIRNDVWIYILCVLGLLWFVTEFLRAQSALRRAMFRLERETALRTRNTALLFITLLTAIALLVTYVNVQVRPQLPPELLRAPTPTPESGVFASPTATDQPSAEEPTPTSPIPATVTLSSGATPILTGTLPLEPLQTPVDDEPGAETTIAGCQPQATITEPFSGATVQGTLNVYGSANIDDFGFYELEIRGPQTNDRYATLLGQSITRPVQEGILGGNLNLAEWASGPYQLRLTVANASGDVTNQCLVDFRLDNG